MMFHPFSLTQIVSRRFYLAQGGILVFPVVPFCRFAVLPFCRFAVLPFCRFAVMVLAFAAICTGSGTTPAPNRYGSK
ncbi:MAG: hypothetical protein ACRCR1_08910 [Aeromonas sp.]